MKIIKYIFIGLIAASCNVLSKKDEPTSKTIAKAGTEVLSINDYKENYIAIESENDSTILARKSIENWAIESLFFQEAMMKLNPDEIDIDKQMEAYKKSLVNYIYQTKLIEANLDTNISKGEIEQYYNENEDNFILKENIVKVNYFKIPIKAPGLEKIKKLLRSYAYVPKDVEALKNLCVQNAENFFMNDSTWLYLEDIKKEMPKLREQPDFNLGQGRIIEFTDDFYYYYLKIKEVKVKNGLSPLNFEKQNIKNFIINRKKTQLINDYKSQLLEKAKSEKLFEVY
ncbi:MAG: hypothetical protein Q7W45_17070 [Bacteroidota bacterium]|nr:hypothetical protein [Bacteroidota bacterium]MDP3145273.1 hypothetical protein [Bacteroidota bacterium]